jgi:hypothetical protein
LPRLQPAVSSWRVPIASAPGSRLVAMLSFQRFEIAEQSDHTEDLDDLAFIPMLA